jgi:hypothetical protein
MTMRTSSVIRTPGRSILAVIASFGRASANCWSVAYKSVMRRASRSSRLSVDIGIPLTQEVVRRDLVTATGGTAFPG